MAREKEYVDAEVVTDETTTSKENIFQKMWNSTKQSFNDSILEYKIESAYKKENKEFIIYKKDSIINQSVSGAINKNVLTIFGKHSIDLYSIVIENKTEKPYYIYKIEDSKVHVTIDTTVYERDGMKLYLKDDLQEVDVIKANGKYYLYKG